MHPEQLDSNKYFNIHFHKPRVSSVSAIILLSYSKLQPTMSVIFSPALYS
jgi:hypothetical protein